MDNRTIDQSKLSRTIALRIGGIAALANVVVVILEIAESFFPGGNEPVETVLDWYNQLQKIPFVGLRNLGLLNIFMIALGIPMYFALYTA